MPMFSQAPLWLLAPAPAELDHVLPNSTSLPAQSPLASAATELRLHPLMPSVRHWGLKVPPFQVPAAHPSIDSITGITCQAGCTLAVPHVGLDTADLEGRPPALRLAIPAVDGLQLLPIPCHCAGTVRLCVPYAGWVYACGPADLQDTPPGIGSKSMRRHHRIREAAVQMGSRGERCHLSGRRAGLRLEGWRAGGVVVGWGTRGEVMYLGAMKER